MELKRYELEQAQEPTGKRLAGWASTETLDRDGDIIRATAFARTLETYRANPVLLWQHNWQLPIGRVTRVEPAAGRGLYIEAELSDTQQGLDAQTLLRDGVIRDLSIGFTPLQSVPTESGREITDLELFEISLVTVGANPTAEVTQIKSTQQGRPATDSPPVCSLSQAAVALRLKSLEDTKIEH